jgi:flagellar biosynthesis/type III secretory pathway protein FliH
VAEDPDKLPDNHPVLLALKKANKEAETFRKRLAAAEEASQTEAERAVAAAKAEGFAEAMSSAVSQASTSTVCSPISMAGNVPCISARWAARAARVEATSEDLAVRMFILDSSGAASSPPHTPKILSLLVLVKRRDKNISGNHPQR